MGIGALWSGAVSVVVVAVDGKGAFPGAFARGQLTVYGPAHAALAVVLAVAGLLVLRTRGRVAVAALLGVIGLCAAQLAGAGLVARRRWPLYWGCCASGNVTEGDLVRDLATGMAVACSVTAAACVGVLVRKRYLGWRGVWATVAAPVALLVAVALPRLVAGSWEDERELAAWALMYSLPFAGALAISALMERFAALAVATAVACSALVATVGKPFLLLGRPWSAALVLVIAAGVAVAAARLIPRGRRVSAESTTSSG